MKYFQGLGHHCTGVDRSKEALAEACANGQVIEADIEGGTWPLSDRVFDVVIVTNYLWRPLMPRILECLAPDGLLIYETFALGHEKFGKPSRPDFLLKPGELLIHDQPGSKGAWAILTRFAQAWGWDPATQSNRTHSTPT